MSPILEIVLYSIAGGLVYGLIKTLLEMAFPEAFGLEPDWYKDTEETSEEDSEPEWDMN